MKKREVNLVVGRGWGFVYWLAVLCGPRWAALFKRTAARIHERRQAVIRYLAPRVGKFLYRLPQKWVTRSAFWGAVLIAWLMDGLTLEQRAQVSLDAQKNVVGDVEKMRVKQLTRKP